MEPQPKNEEEHSSSSSNITRKTAEERFWSQPVGLGPIRLRLRRDVSLLEGIVQYA